jgi:hypothetical protein
MKKWINIYKHNKVNLLVSIVCFIAFVKFLVPHVAVEIDGFNFFFLSLFVLIFLNVATILGIPMIKFYETKYVFSDKDKQLDGLKKILESLCFFLFIFFIFMF